VVTLQPRLVKIETERTHRRRLRVAAVLAPMERISVEQAFERTAVDPADRAAMLARFGREHVDVGAVTRFLAARHGLTTEETAEAVAQAERVAAQLQARDGEDR